MKPIRVFAMASLLMSGAVLAGLPIQDPPPQQPAPAPAQQPSPQPQAPVPDPNAQRREAIERQRQEQIDRQREAEWRRRANEFFRDATGTAPAPLPRTSKPYIAPVMQHESEFDWNSVPLADWLSPEEKTQIAWKVEVKDSALRMDQRLEVPYTVRIQAKDLNKLGNAPELFFITGVSNPNGDWMGAPKVVRQSFKTALPEEVDLRFSDAVYAEPGDYFLHIILYDRETKKYSMTKRRVVVSPVDNDPFPNASRNLPVVELPRLTDREGGSVLEFFNGLSLPVGNKRPIRLELISVMSAPEQWSGQKNIVRSHNEQIAAAINTLSQMKLAQGSMSVTGLDILHRKVPFRQSDLNSSTLDWKSLAEAFKTIDNDTVSASLLQAKGSAPFFREVMSGQLTAPAGAPRVFIVISSSLLFGQDSDRKPLELQGDCGCRVYHLRFRHTVNDVFDDLERLLRPLRPKTFNLVAPRDLRKAVAEIIRDIENL